jgi:hypothetical protein
MPLLKFGPRPWLTLARQSETLRSATGFWVGVMTRMMTAAVAAAFAGLFLLQVSAAPAQTVPSGMRTAQTSQPNDKANGKATEMSSQRRFRRPVTRLRVFPNDQEPYDVYPRYFPGRNAVRDCNATYVQEYRPSGTVIVPHVNCYWRRG